MREALNPWNYVIASYALGVLGTGGLIALSWLAMRRAEALRDKLRER